MKIHIRTYLFFLGLITFSAPIFSQSIDGEYSSLRKKKIPVTQYDYTLDTLPISSKTLKILSPFPLNYILDPSASLIRFTTSNNNIDSVWVMYRVIPVSAISTYRRRSYDSIRYFFSYQPDPKKETGQPFRWKSGGIKTEGSIGRTMLIGNNRDVSLNSGMNLRMSGYVGDSIEISAVISDDNLPIQPDGNTQFLRDFDRIFLNMKKGRHQVTLGDIDAGESTFRFMNFKKRIQGVRYERDQGGTAPNWSASYTGAVAKGKFFRQVLQPLDGNQGPYRLRGPDNALYLIILSGSERVYWDGELLQRGQDQDYVIDYNLAEITFTPRRPINKDRRIQVEFEYSERNYVNSLIYLKNEWKLTPDFNISTGYYRSGDVKNSPIDQSLSNQEKQLLSAVGDSIQSAFIPGAIMDTFFKGKVLYFKQDTLFNGIRDSVFVYAGRDTDRLYRVEFLFLGQGKGNYVQTGTSSNNKIFKWVAPDALNQPTGQWEPVRFVYTPKRLELISLRSEWTHRQSLYLQTDISYSRNDINLFSKRDKKNDEGLAGKMMLRKTVDLLYVFHSSHRLVLEGSYEQVMADFRSTERIRPVEFYRDWSLFWDVLPEKEQFMYATAKIKGMKGGTLDYEAARFVRGLDYQGNRHSISQQSVFSGFKTEYRVQYTDLKKKNTKGYFFRPFVSVSKSLGKNNRWLAGGSYFSDQNKLSSRINDTLVPESFSFQEYKTFLECRIQESGRWGLGYFSRINYIPSGKKFSELDRSHNYVFQFDWQDDALFQVRMNSAYRILNNKQTLQKDKNLTNRTEINVSTKKRWADAQLIYETSGAQEQQREFSYVAVPTGQGMFYWIDYNQNGIEELNEFEPAVFQDQKKYIRVYTPVSRYVRCLQSLVNLSLQLSPGNLMSKKSTSIIHRLSTASYLQFNNKTFAGNQLIKNPFLFNQHDTSVIATQYFTSHTLFLNRNNRIWVSELTMDRSVQKSLMLYGYEQSTSGRYYVNTRINWTSAWSTSLVYQTGRQYLQTDNASFLNRNYDIRKYYLEPGISYLFQKKLRTTLSHRVQSGKNLLSSHEQIRTNVNLLDIRYQIPSGGSIQFRYAQHQIRTVQTEKGFTPTPASYLLLEGLQPGNNQTWSLEMIQRFAGNLEFNVQYEGRKTDLSIPIHTGRATIRALF